ncbi:F-box protein At1g60400-like [Trifolium pratense]|uniref:F-box protein At1g60400-like n=1 Tax=Trifolium pratense TaxID=57577 RepID=UPI001E694DAB|nr:F-box protein At1g60400-like [Trifolium pratense]
MKRQKESDIDRLSALPDHLLLHIIQFMTTQQSAQTCVLSKRWENLWKSVTNINLHHFELYDGDIFEDFVSHFLSTRDNSIPLHTISYANGCRNYPYPAQTNIPIQIMEYAASHDVQQLEINTQLDHITSTNFELPLSIFNCASLTSLSLCLWDVTKLYTIMFPKSLNLPALKTLKLSCFTFFTGDNGYAEPFSTCNMLSKLAIMACRIQDDAQGICISNSKVSNLAIGVFHPTSKICKVILCTPKLTSLTIKDIVATFPAPSSSTCNLNLLEELKFECTHGPPTMGDDNLIGWLHLIAKVKIMTLSFTFLTLLVNVLKRNDSLKTQFPSFVKLKSLKVESYPWESDEEARELVTYLLRNSPPPATFVISQEGVDLTSDGCVFVGFNIPR